jgi:hypothetical protein
VIDVPFAHVAGMPLEETLASFGPLLFVGFGVAWANLRSRLRPIRSRAGPHDHPHKEGARSAGGPVCHLGRLPETERRARVNQTATASRRSRMRRWSAGFSTSAARISADPRALPSPRSARSR